MSEPKLTNLALKKIVNVYQLQFLGFKPPGFGDFLRGCFSMVQFINVINEHYGTNIEFDIDICNHPMSKYMVTPKVKPVVPYEVLTEFVILPRKVSDKESADYMLKEITERFNALQLNSEGVYHGFCCKYEVYDEFKESDKEFIRSKLSPSPSMVCYIESVLNDLDLKAKEYSVLHVRCSDEDSFPPKPLTESYFARLDQLVSESVEPGKKYLVLSNHNEVKEHYKNRYYTRESNICHLGLAESPSDDAVRDTMLDYYLVSMANDVIGITPYGICGFSQECAKLYNIPHKYVKFPEPTLNFTMAHMPPAQRMMFDLIRNSRL